MMMCVDTIRAVKHMHKEIRITNTLRSTRKITARSIDGRSASASPARMNQSQLSINTKTLAELQEDMKQDFQTPLHKEIAEANKKVKRLSRKEALECSMRLTGSANFQMANRHRHVSQENEDFRETGPLQDTAVDKQISSTPIRFRSMK